MSTTKEIEQIEDYKYGFNVKSDSVFDSGRGLTAGIVEEISRVKGEPDWMREFRLNAYDIFCRKKMPSWGVDLSKLDFETIRYYVKPSDKVLNKWEDVPAEIKETFDRLGVPEAEREFLAGSGSQFDSEMVYHNLKSDLQKKRGTFFGY